MSTKEESRAWRASLAPDHRERVNADIRARHRAAGYTSQKQYEKDNPEKRAAYAAIKYALKMGYVQREPCLFCDVDQTEAHHHSYSRDDRLNVTWLCRRHHRLAHRII